MQTVYKITNQHVLPNGRTCKNNQAIMRNQFYFIVAIMLLVLSTSCNRIEIKTDKVGIYANDYGSVIPTPSPKKVVINKTELLLVYSKFTLPFKIIELKHVNTLYQSSKGEPDSTCVTQYTMIHPYLGNVTNALLFDKYDNGEIVARELGLEVNYPSMKNPILAFVEEGHIWK